MLQSIERYMKQAIVDKNHAVSSAALVSSLVIKFDIVITLNFNFLSIILKGGITQIYNNIWFANVRVCLIINIWILLAAS